MLEISLKKTQISENHESEMSFFEPVENPGPTVSSFPLHEDPLPLFLLSRATLKISYAASLNRLPLYETENVVSSSQKP